MILLSDMLWSVSNEVSLLATPETALGPDVPEGFFMLRSVGDRAMRAVGYILDRELQVGDDPGMKGVDLSDGEHSVVFETQVDPAQRFSYITVSATAAPELLKPGEKIVVTVESQNVTAAKVGENSYQVITNRTQQSKLADIIFYTAQRHKNNREKSA